MKLALPCILLLLVLALALAACDNGSSTSNTPITPVPTSSPVTDNGTQLLTQAGQKLNGARTLHALANISLAGPGVNGTVKSEIWNQTPNENRSVVLQSSITQFATGMLTVSDGKQIWQYNPQQKVAYHAQISASSSGTATPGETADQSQTIFNLVRSVFTHSNATLVSSSAKINGHPVNDVAITSQAASNGSGTNNITYSGDIFLDKTSGLPVRVSLHVQGLGQITLDLLSLDLNQELDESLFTFTPPPGVKVQPFPTDSTATGNLSLAQAQQQAGYHLLSIPVSNSAYKLLSIDALGAPGNQVYSLNYQTQAGIKFTIAQSKALANLPVSGNSVKIRGTTATVSSAGSAPSISWTEKGIGIQIVGPLSSSQLTAIANLLS